MLIHLLTFIILLPLATASAADWREGEGIVTLANITPEEARQRAWDKARENALSKMGQELVGFTTGKLEELKRSGRPTEVREYFARSIQTFTRGFIAKEEPLFDGPEMQAIPGTNQTQLVYRVKIRAQVEMETTGPDPNFQISLTLNQTRFRAGETLSIRVKSTADCRITILNLYALDSLRVLFPNPHTPDNRLLKNVLRTIPAPEDIWDIPISLLPDRDEDVESLLVVATKDDIPFPTLDAVSVDNTLAMSQAMTLISNWLMKIPADRRTQEMTTYDIMK